MKIKRLCQHFWAHFPGIEVEKGAKRSPFFGKQIASNQYKKRSCCVSLDRGWLST